jgi:hypothetical protein
MARALYDYSPTDADRMPLQRGELVRGKQFTKMSEHGKC